MNTDFYVVKFGEKYYKETAITGGAIALTLVDSLTSARKYIDLDRKNIQRLLDIGGNVVEVNIREYDRTFTVRREWEEADKEEN